MAEALVVLRFVHFAAAMACFGVGAFRLYAFAGRASADAAAEAAFDTRLRRGILGGAAVTLLTGIAMVPCIAASMAGAASAGFDPKVLEPVMLDTRFGHIWCAHLVLAALLVALSALPQRHEFAGATMIAALLTLASLGWVGHAAMDQGAAGIGHRVNQMAHLLAGGIWLGGLPPLFLLLRRALAPGGAEFQALARTALPHFSLMGYVAVALVALTGAINTVLLVGSFHGLVATPYGRLLLVKIALFAAMVALALVNRFRLLPRLRGTARADPPLRALCRSVAVEQALGLAILAVVAVLGTWPPAIMAMPG
jgi:putative copper resistance protein D